jgi:hypothetical protein
MKNFILLGLLTIVTLSYAKEPIEKESMEEAEGFTIQKATPEKQAGRAFAGGKATKKETDHVSKDEDGAKTEDSEVQYWRYQE